MEQADERADKRTGGLHFRLKPILWRADTTRYLGVHFVRAKYFKCSLDYAKRSFHRATNSVFW